MGDIKVGTHWLASFGNQELCHFLNQAKAELKHTVPHRQGIINGYNKINLDFLCKEGLITESERRAATSVLQKIEELL